MALIVCSECGKEISSFAASCPYCGAPISVSNSATECVVTINKTKSFGTFPTKVFLDDVQIGVLKSKETCQTRTSMGTHELKLQIAPLNTQKKLVCFQNPNELISFSVDGNARIHYDIPTVSSSGSLSNNNPKANGHSKKKHGVLTGLVAIITSVIIAIVCISIISNSSNDTTFSLTPATDAIKITQADSESEETVSNDTQHENSDIVLVDDDNFTLTYKGLFDQYGSFLMPLRLNNKTDSDVLIRVSDIQFDTEYIGLGIIGEPGGVTGIKPDSFGTPNVGVPKKTTMEHQSLDDIQTLIFSVTVYDSSWNSLAEYGPFTVTR